MELHRRIAQVIGHSGAGGRHGPGPSHRTGHRPQQGAGRWHGTAPSHRTGDRPQQALADRTEPDRRIGQVISGIGQRADRTDLDRRIGQVIGRSKALADCTEPDRRIGQVISGIGERPDRTERHRRVGQVITAAASASRHPATTVRIGLPGRAADVGRTRRRHSLRTSANSHGRSVEGRTGRRASPRR